MKVGNTMYLLSDGGRPRAISVRMGGNVLPITPSFGTVCFAVGELNFKRFSAERQPKNTKFLILI